MSPQRIILLCLIALNALFWIQPVRADDNAQPTDTGTGDAAPLPAIEAKTLHLKPIKISSGRKSYVLEKIQSPEGEAEVSEPVPEETPDASDNGTGVRKKGKIILLRQEGENIMALRVMQEDPDHNQVYVRRIRQYGDHDELAMGSNYLAIEKIMDVVPPSPQEQKEERKDLKELGAPKQFDADVDSPSSPAPGDNPDAIKKAEDTDEVPIGASVDEVGRHNNHHQWLTVGYALLRNVPSFSGGNLAIGGNFYSSGGVRYAYTFKDHIWFNNGSREDSLTVEGGLYYYKILSLDVAGDSYTVMPVIGTVRYNMFLNENWGWFLYGGFEYNRILDADQSTDSAQTYNTRIYNLSRTLPCAGAGALVRFGPEWYVRVEAGIDVVGASLVLRF
jgi:hypothetical protein